MSNRFTEHIDILKAAFRARFLPGTLTANRQYDLPDDSGQISLINAATQAFVAAVPFRKIVNTYATQAVTAAITFTIAAGTKVPGTRSVYRLIANGINIPNITAFKETAHSLGYDNRSGSLNLLDFFFDGFDHWVTITQQIGALPTLANIALTFPATTNRSTNVTQSGADWGLSGSGAATFAGQMVAIQSAPASKTAVLIAEVDDLMLIGFNASPALEGYTNFEYHAWISAGKLFSNIAGGTLVDHGAITPATNVWLRLTRAGNTGVVTLHRSVSPGTTWTLVRTFANANAGVLYPAFDLSENITTRQLRIVSFEVQP